MKKISILPIEEHQLVQKCIKQERHAQKMLYQKYARKMFNLVYRILGDQGLAEDALQEGFIAVFKSLSKFKEESSLETWMRKIFTYKAVNILKSNTKIKFDYVEIEVAEEETTDWDRYDQSALQIKNAIQTMPIGYKTILTLYLIEGYDHQEISQILNISATTSRSQLYRGKQLLQERLKNRKWISKNS